MQTNVESATEATELHARNWLVKVLDEHFNQRQLVFDDPKVTGRQAAHEAGFRPADEAIVLQQLKNGETEELRLDELLDLRSAGVERLFIMYGDRTFRLSVDGLRLEWPRAEPTGRVIRLLADRDDQFEVVREMENVPDRVVGEDEVVSLDGRDTERFNTRRIDRFVTVFYGDTPHRLPRGEYSTEQLGEEFKVPAGHLLDLIADDGTFEELKPGQRIRLKEAMKFVSHPPCGQSS